MERNEALQRVREFRAQAAAGSSTAGPITDALVTHFGFTEEEINPPLEPAVAVDAAPDAAPATIDASGAETDEAVTVPEDAPRGDIDNAADDPFAPLTPTTAFDGASIGAAVAAPDDNLRDLVADRTDASRVEPSERTEAPSPDDVTTDTIPAPVAAEGAASTEDTDMRKPDPKEIAAEEDAFFGEPDPAPAPTSTVPSAAPARAEDDDDDPYAHEGTGKPITAHDDPHDLRDADVPAPHPPPPAPVHTAAPPPVAPRAPAPPPPPSAPPPAAVSAHTAAPPPVPQAPAPVTALVSGRTYTPPPPRQRWGERCDRPIIARERPLKGR